MKRSIVSVKKFVNNHKTGIAVATTATLCLALEMHVVRLHNDFLKEHDLFDKFYALDEEE